MDVRELPSDSDESDEDYVPSGAENDPLSEVESEDGDEDNSADSEGEEIENTGKRKRGQKKNKMKQRKKGQKSKKKIVVEEPEEEEEKIKSEKKKSIIEEEEKKKADSLWSDFMKDAGIVPRANAKTVLSNGNLSKKVEAPSAKLELPKKQKDNKVTITKVFEFAGEEVRVTKQVDADSAEARVSEVPQSASGSPAATQGRGLKGLSSVLSNLGKKAKIGTLEKSKLDWDHFKKSQGIDDEIQTFNRGKDGYLEKQDFLQRADLRQFEIEKELRTTRRSNR